MPLPRIGLPEPLTTEAIDAVVLPALAEDTQASAGKGTSAAGRDVTSECAVPASARATARS